MSKAIAERILKQMEDWNFVEFRHDENRDAVRDELATLLAALDGEWQSERPSPGLWWVAIAPDKRSDLSFWSGTDPIKDVWVAKSGEVFQGNMSLSDEILTGALWQRRAVPGDPFAKGGK